MQKYKILVSDSRNVRFNAINSFQNITESIRIISSFTKDTILV